MSNIIVNFVIFIQHFDMGGHNIRLETEVKILKVYCMLYIVVASVFMIYGYID